MFPIGSLPDQKKTRNTIFYREILACSIKNREHVKMQFDLSSFSNPQILINPLVSQRKILNPQVENMKVAFQSRRSAATRASQPPRTSLATIRSARSVSTHSAQRTGRYSRRQSTRASLASTPGLSTPMRPPKVRRTPWRDPQTPRAPPDTTNRWTEATKSRSNDPKSKIQRLKGIPLRALIMSRIKIKRRMVSSPDYP